MKERVTTTGVVGMDTSVTAWGTELTPVNGNNSSLSKGAKMILAPAFLVFIIALVGMAGNAVVLWLLGFRLRRNPFSVYILNLAGADCLFLCCQVMYSLRTFINNFHSVYISIPYISTVSIFAYISGLSILSAFSTERCLSVLWPIWYRCRRPRHMSAIMCALIWALSLLLSILDGIYCGFLGTQRDKSSCRAFDFIIVMWLILLFMLLSGSSLALMTRLLCGSQRVPLTRLYLTLMLTVLVFLLCGLPFGFKWFLCYWIQCGETLSYLLKCTGIILSSLNSSANPIIYFFVGSFRQQKQLRQTLGLVLQRALEDITEVKNRGGKPSQEPGRLQEAVSPSVSLSSRVQSEI